MQLSDIRIYPLKSGSGSSRESAVVEPWGLAGDRRWAVIGAGGDDLRLGEFPKKLTVTARNLADGGLALTAPGMPDLTLPPAEGGQRVPVGFSGLDHAVLAAPQAHGWFTWLLGHPARLVWLDDPRRRPVAPRHGGLPGDTVSFASDAPLLLTSLSSLKRLDEWIIEGAAERGEDPPQPLEMARFRPSVVIDGAEPYEEDGWAEVRIGEVDFRVTVICDRCAVTMIDPATAMKGREPLRTLARHRKWDGKTWFGIRLVPRNTGAISVGDPVTPLRRR
ncbi:MOSC domain-containing protein [Sphaerimonospora cavernae]|uniref:MOSC domain-containing protein n=1 Tax=Sphaerimonospora cavernae TaxID=1740611 RepID=A0ABV6U4V2_9ACTN